jgi:manganese transport protein
VRALRESRIDTVIAVSLGGLVTLAVVITAAAFYTQGTTVDSAAAMADQLEPLLGRSARTFFAIGLMAAGLTSAVTAPLAAAYATCGMLGWRPDLKSGRFRAIWLIVVLVGIVLALALGGTPVAAIIFAQAANGLILPVIAVFLLLVINRKGLLGRYVNGALANVLGAGVVLIAAGLGVYKLIQAAHRIAS